MTAAFSSSLVRGFGSGGVPARVDITPTNNPPHCKKWLLAFAQWDSKPNAVIPGKMFSFPRVINYYVANVGVPQHFMYGGYLWKFAYTGYDEKTGKWSPGGKNVIYICIDGMDVQENPPGSPSHFTVYPGGSGESLVMQTSQALPVSVTSPNVAKAAAVRQERPFMNTFQTSRGVGCGPAGRVFSPALLRGLGRMQGRARGLGQFVVLDTSSVPPVSSENWVEFYPNDTENYLTNTNLINQMNTIIGTVQASKSYSTVYWLLTDSSSNAAWTVSTLGTGVSLIRSSYPGNKLKLEIAAATDPVPAQLVPGAILGGTVNGSAQCGPGGVPKWLSVYGPGGNVASAAGLTVALTQDQAVQQLNYYLAYLNQPQFLNGEPSLSQPWTGFHLPYPTVTSVPTIYFSYGGQLYRAYWYGSWTPGQIGGAPGSGPALDVCANPASPPAFTPVSVPGIPSLQALQPATPTGMITSGIPSLQALQPGAVSSAGYGSVAAPAAPGSVNSSSLSTSEIVVIALLGAGIVGGAAYLLFE
jgi:hypothetical protein